MKKILITLLALTSVLGFSTEITLDAGIGYNMRTINSKATAFKFAPLMPMYVNLSFNPTEINLKGNFNIINEEIDGLFKESTTITGFAISGDAKFLSEKLIGGLKIAANLNIIANAGKQYPEYENPIYPGSKSGDMILELGPVYAITNNHSLGLLAYYESNQLINPKAAGATLTSTIFNDHELSLTLGYNLEKLSELKTTANLNEVDLDKEYTLSSSSDEVYFFDEATSKINSLVPLLVKLKAEGSHVINQRFTLNYSLDETLMHNKFSGLLSKANLTSSEYKSIMENKEYNDLEKRIKIAESLKSEASRTDANDIQLDETTSDFGLNLNLITQISENLTLDSNAYLGVSNGVSTLSGSKSNFFRLTPNFDTTIIHIYDILQVDRLSLETTGTLYSQTVYQKSTDESDLMVRQPKEDGPFTTKDTSFTSILGVKSRFAVRYGIFDTFTVKGGIGFGVDGIIHNKNDKLQMNYRGMYPEIFIQMSYEW